MTAIAKTVALPRVPIRFFERYGIWLVLIGLLIIAGIASEAFFPRQLLDEHHPAGEPHRHHGPSA